MANNNNPTQAIKIITRLIIQDFNDQSEALNRRLEELKNQNINLNEQKSQLETKQAQLLKNQAALRQQARQELKEQELLRISNRNLQAEIDEQENKSRESRRLELRFDVLKNQSRATEFQLNQQLNDELKKFEDYSERYKNLDQDVKTQQDKLTRLRAEFQRKYPNQPLPGESAIRQSISPAPRQAPAKQAPAKQAAPPSVESTETKRTGPPPSSASTRASEIFRTGAGGQPKLVPQRRICLPSDNKMALERFSCLVDNLYVDALIRDMDYREFGKLLAVLFPTVGCKTFAKTTRSSVEDKIEKLRLDTKDFVEFLNFVYSPQAIINSQNCNEFSEVLRKINVKYHAFKNVK